MKKLKFISLVTLLLLLGLGVFTSPDLIQSDRDNAVIISARSLMSLESPYTLQTEIGQKITTGLFNAILSVPFVYLFGNIQLLSFLFYATFLWLAYRSKYYYLYLFLLILFAPLIYRIMYYRLDELYWVVFYIAGLFYFKSNYKYLLLIPIIFSRNIFNFDFKVLLYNIDYYILIFVIYTIFLYKIKVVSDANRKE